MYKSTRNSKLRVSSYEAIVQGLSDEGGLFVPDIFPSLDYHSLINMSYQQITVEILHLFFPEFSIHELEVIVHNGYDNNFKGSLCEIKDFERFSVLELYHGPTCAFKDMALTIFPHLYEASKKHLNITSSSTILTATSGDTGGACLSGFYNSENTNVIVLYPNDGISKIQERQMHSFASSRNKVIAFDGNFDDCQNFVKEIFTDSEYKKYNLSSANSINIGRLVPQIVYYYYAYLHLLSTNKIYDGERINVCVPTGNFGDILASYYAKKMGLPIAKFVCASNQNNVLADFFETGKYDRNRKFYTSISPSMDILISSNLERLLYDLSSDEYVNHLMKDLKETGRYQVSKELKNRLSDFIGSSLTEEETRQTIKNTFDDKGYLIDPHTSVALGCYQKTKMFYHTVIVSTAHPYKFPVSVLKSLGEMETDEFKAITKLEMLTKVVNIDNIEKLKDVQIHKTIWNKENAKEKIKELLEEERCIK